MSNPTTEQQARRSALMRPPGPQGDFHPVLPEPPMIGTRDPVALSFGRLQRRPDARPYVDADRAARSGVK